jgi:hypothetical protein
MRDIIVMQVGYTFHDLLKDKSGIVFSKFSPFPDIIEQITSGAKLHDNHVMLIRLECLQDLNIIGVSQGFQDIDLVHDFTLLTLFLQEVHID